MQRVLRPVWKKVPLAHNAAAFSRSPTGEGLLGRMAKSCTAGLCKLLIVLKNCHIAEP